MSSLKPMSDVLAIPSPPLQSTAVIYLQPSLTRHPFAVLTSERTRIVPQLHQRTMLRQLLPLLQRPRRKGTTPLSTSGRVRAKRRLLSSSSSSISLHLPQRPILPLTLKSSLLVGHELHVSSRAWTSTTCPRLERSITNASDSVLYETGCSIPL